MVAKFTNPKKKEVKTSTESCEEVQVLYVEPGKVRRQVEVIKVEQGLRRVASQNVTYVSSDSDESCVIIHEQGPPKENIPHVDLGKNSQKTNYNF